jgi:YggT family protein
MLISNILLLLIKALDLYLMILFIYALMSWFYNATQTKLYSILAMMIEPLLSYIRRLPLQFAGMDFSILALGGIIWFAQRGLAFIAIMLLS